MTYEQALALVGEQPTWALRHLIAADLGRPLVRDAARLVLRYRNRKRRRGGDELQEVKGA